MAHSVLIDPRFTFNAVDLADHVQMLDLNVHTDQIEDVAGGDTFAAFMAGIRRFGATIEGMADHAVGEVDATIFAAWAARSAVAIALGADRTAAISTSNPEYQFTAFVAEYTPLQHRMNEAAKFRLTVAPTTDLVRDVTP